MGRALRFRSILAATLLSGALALHAQAQTASPSCSADGPRDESGRPRCCPDGSSPDGGSQCWCELRIVHLRDYRNPKYEYEVHVPDGIAEILGCSGIGTGFKISLTYPDRGPSEGDLAWNQIWVGRAERTNDTFQQMADKWAQQQREVSESDHYTDLQIDPPVQTSLSSLAAIELRASRTELDRGTLIYEVITAKAHDNYAYVIGMVTPAEQYEKNEKLFKAIVGGFRYVPLEPNPQ
jgi:hypothetical protein